jgi:hypothetical protein
MDLSFTPINERLQLLLCFKDWFVNTFPNYLQEGFILIKGHATYHHTKIPNTGYKGTVWNMTYRNHT